MINMVDFPRVAWNLPPQTKPAVKWWCLRLCFCLGPPKTWEISPRQKGGFVGQRWDLHRWFSTVDSTCFPTTRCGWVVAALDITWVPSCTVANLLKTNKTCRTFGCVVHEFVIWCIGVWMSLWKKSWGILIVLRRSTLNLNIGKIPTFQPPLYWSTTDGSIFHGVYMRVKHAFLTPNS